MGGNLVFGTSDIAPEYDTIRAKAIGYASAGELATIMAIRSLNRLRWLRLLLIKGRNGWLWLRHGVSIDSGASLSLSATAIPGCRGAIRVEDGTLVAFKVLLIALDHDGSVRPIRIGRNCFIGGGATILPGVTIGDGSIVGAGAVVFDDVPPGCAVGGNPAKILRENLELGRFGRLGYADENIRRLYR